MHSLSLDLGLEDPSCWTVGCDQTQVPGSCLLYEHSVWWEKLKKNVQLEEEALSVILWILKSQTYLHGRKRSWKINWRRWASHLEIFSQTASDFGHVLSNRQKILCCFGWERMLEMASHGKVSKHTGKVNKYPGLLNDFDAVDVSEACILKFLVIIWVSALLFLTSLIRVCLSLGI